MKNLILFFLILLAKSALILSQSVEIKNNQANILMKVNDEGTSGSITLPTGSTPAITTYKVYNIMDTLFWSGSKLVKKEDLPWKRNASDIYFNTGKIGVGLNSPTADLQVSGTSGVCFTGIFNSGSIPVEGSGTRAMWYPKKAAFRSGYINGTQWNDNYIGNYSVAMGVNTTASGNYSFAMGSSTEASGLGSVSFGDRSTATGNNAAALGDRTSANSFSSTVIGRYNVGGGNTSYWVSTDPLFEIGNGVPPGPGVIAKKSNAFTVLKNGNVGIGDNSPDVELSIIGNDDSNNGILHVRNYYDGFRSAGIFIQLGATTCDYDNNFLRFINGNNVYVGGINGDGSGGAHFYSYSDKRLKINIRDFNHALDKIKNIEVKEYEGLHAPGKKQVGFLAQDLQKVYPQAVSGNPGGNALTEPMAVDYGRLTPLLLKAIQEQQEIIEQLTKRIEVLEAGHTPAKK